MPRTPSHLQGLAAKNPPSAEYKKEVFKYIPIMRQYGLDAAADYLRDWVDGQVVLAPASGRYSVLGLHHDLLLSMFFFGILFPAVLSL